MKWPREDLGWGEGLCHYGPCSPWLVCGFTMGRQCLMGTLFFFNLFYKNKLSYNYSSYLWKNFPHSCMLSAVQLQYQQQTHLNSGELPKIKTIPFFIWFIVVYIILHCYTKGIHNPVYPTQLSHFSKNPKSNILICFYSCPVSCYGLPLITISCKFQKCWILLAILSSP